MATDTSWGYEGWSSYNWGGISSDVTVYVGGTTDGSWGSLTFGSGPWGQITPDPNLQLTLSTPPVYDSWGLNAWGEYPYSGGQPIVISASANVILSSAELGIQTGTLQFIGNAYVTTTGSQLTLVIDNAIVRASTNATTSGNLLELLVQNPSISAKGFTEAVVGNELGIGLGTLNFKLDQIFPVTGSSVQIGSGQVTIALPTIVTATGTSLTTQVGNVNISAKNYIDVEGNQVSISTGTPILSLGVGVTATGSSVSIQTGTPTIRTTYYVTGNQVNIGVADVTIQIGRAHV